MVRVAVKTANQRTTLEPQCLWYGDLEHPFIHWLRAQNVTVWPLRTPFYNALAEIADRQNSPYIHWIGADAFLRLEIPALAAREGWRDEFVLYTDCDVMFLRDPVPGLRKLRPKYFAVAPEEHAHYRFIVNSGVMLINLRGMQSVDADFQSYTREHLERCVTAPNTFDQAALISYFRLVTRALVRRGAPVRVQGWKGYRTIWGRFYVRLPFLDPILWDELPLVFNWKAYWPQNEDAVILHFHGPKPNQTREEILREQVLHPMLNSNYEHWQNEWTRVLEAVETDGGKATQ